MIDVVLRPFREEDLPVLDRFATEPAVLGEHQWSGFTDPRARRRRWAEDGFLGARDTAPAVVADDAVAGMASCEAADRGGPAGGCFEIGLTLLPEHRGRGTGLAAHRLLVAHLFAVTRAHRLEAFTDGENVAEQKTLERAGFHREGVMRQVTWRNGSWRDEVIYALFRP
ncbi:GNAT family N-acetyltransferase [Amycolatopsis sp. NPDC049252]|uniref:GNAT family N-acetyltransferase n=1 Tax=Amycolatopsis sp. NPDC049252 TaxID=3363933 RepID=UPI00370FB71A